MIYCFYIISTFILLWLILHMHCNFLFRAYKCMGSTYLSVNLASPREVLESLAENGATSLWNLVDLEPDAMMCTARNMFDLTSNYPKDYKLGGRNISSNSLIWVPSSLEGCYWLTSPQSMDNLSDRRRIDSYILDSNLRKACQRLQRVYVLQNVRFSPFLCILFTYYIYILLKYY